MKVSSRTAWWFAAGCAFSCGLCVLAAVLLPVISYAAEGTASAEYPMSFLLQGMILGVLSYIFRMIRQKALRQEAERAERAESSTGR